MRCMVCAVSIMVVVRVEVNSFSSIIKVLHRSFHVDGSIRGKLEAGQVRENPPIAEQKKKEKSRQM